MVNQSGKHPSRNSFFENVAIEVVLPVSLVCGAALFGRLIGERYIKENSDQATNTTGSDASSAARHR